MTNLTTRLCCAAMSLVGAAGLVAFSAPAVATATSHPTFNAAATTVAAAPAAIAPRA